MIYNVQLYFGEPVNDYATEFLTSEAFVMRDSIKRFFEDMKNRDITLDFNKIMLTMTLGFLANFRECLEEGLLDYMPDECDEKRDEECDEECDKPDPTITKGKDEDDEVLLIPASFVRDKVRAIMRVILGHDEN